MGDQVIELVGTEPAHGWIAPEPGQLPFGIASRVPLDRLDRFGKGEAAVEIVEQLRISDRPECIQVAVGICLLYTSPSPRDTR